MCEGRRCRTASLGIRFCREYIADVRTRVRFRRDDGWRPWVTVMGLRQGLVDDKITLPHPIKVRVADAWDFDLGSLSKRYI